MDRLRQWLDESDARYCYADKYALERALKHKVVETLLQLSPSPPRNLKRLGLEEKIEALEYLLIYQQRDTKGHWYKQNPLEILACMLWLNRDIPGSVADRIWFPVQAEAQLLTPVATYFLQADYRQLYPEVYLGKKRADLVCYRKGSFLRREEFIAVELKNNLKEFERGLNQMATYAGFVNKVYLACTPSLAAQYTFDYCRGYGVIRWDAHCLSTMLRRSGLGLLLVEDTEVTEVVEAKRLSPPPDRLDHLRSDLGIE